MFRISLFCLGFLFPSLAFGWGADIKNADLFCEVPPIITLKNKQHKVVQFNGQHIQIVESSVEEDEAKIYFAFGDSYIKVAFTGRSSRANRDALLKLFNKCVVERSPHVIQDFPEN